jgi:hypothetical protein
LGDAALPKHLIDDSLGGRSRLRTKLLELLPVGVTVTEIHEAAIPRVDSEYAARVFDRAPVLLGTRPDLANIREDTVRIGSICAIKFLKRVEVAQLLAVERQAVGAAHARDPIHREAHRLVYGDK